MGAGGERAEKGRRGARARALAAVLLCAVAWAAGREMEEPPAVRCLRPSAAARGPRVECAGPASGQAELPLGTRRVLGLPVDLNALSAQDFAALSGVGEKLARRIVEERRRRGGFAGVDDLARVKGIGPAKLAALRGALEPPVP